jgi:hypothetical protein
MQAFEVMGTIDENGQLILDRHLNIPAPSRVKVIVLSLFCHSHGSIKGKALRDKGFRLFTLILTPQGFSSVKSRVSEYSLLRVTEER